MRSIRSLAVWGMALLACLWLISCTSPATPTAEPQASLTASPSATRTPLTAIPTPTDVSAPRVSLADMPAVVQATDGLKVVATASDDLGVTRMALMVDGQRLHQAEEATLRYNVDTRALAPGDHVLVVRAWDAAGNEGRTDFAFTLAAPAVTPSTMPSPIPEPTTTPSASATLEASATPRPTAWPTGTAVPVEPVTAYWDEISIATYGYQAAEYTDPAGAGQPYPLLDWERVSGPAPKTYRVLVLRNAYLEVTLLPELGGRIYQCRYLPTGQELFYNNRAIKPTHWGPADQGWWLAVGGMEWCLPVDEHGYVTAEPWDVELVRSPDGSATAILRITERSRNLHARVDVTLSPGEAGLRVRMALENPDANPKAFQYWINAMLSPGAHGVQPSLRFYYPTDAVLVHSRGDAALPDAGASMPWPLYDGRDLSAYATWRNWLGFFAPALRAAYTAVYDTAARVGMVRTFPPDAARGSKLFGFGQGFDPGVYTDDGTQYVEMWGGLTPTFWDYATLDGYGRVAWDEYWYVLAGVDGLSVANAQAVLYVTRDQAALDVTVASPGAHVWTLVVQQGERELERRPCAVQPDAPYHLRLENIVGNSGQTLTVRIVDAAGHEVLAFTI